MITRRRFLQSSALAIPASAALTRAAFAGESSPEAFFKGRTITAIAPAGPESTFTILSRLIAPYLAKYTGAEVLVKPMQAGGGYQARNYMYKAEPDGLTVVLIGHGPKMITGSMFQRDGARYDWKTFTPLGKIIESSYAVYVAADSNWNTPADMRDVAFNFGESSTFFAPQIAEALGWSKMKVIPGYKSSAGRTTAVSRNEIQATAGSIELKTAQPDAVKCMVTPNKLRDFPEVPTLSDYATEEGKVWADHVKSWTNLLYMSYAPPGLPSDRAAFLQQGLKKTWADPDFAADLKRMDLVPSESFISGNNLTQEMSGLAAMSDDEIAEMSHVIYDKYRGV